MLVHPLHASADVAEDSAEEACVAACDSRWTPPTWQRLAKSAPRRARTRRGFRCLSQLGRARFLRVHSPVIFDTHAQRRIRSDAPLPTALRGTTETATGKSALDTPSALTELLLRIAFDAGVLVWRCCWFCCCFSCFAQAAFPLADIIGCGCGSRILRRRGDRASTCATPHTHKHTHTRTRTQMHIHRHALCHHRGSPPKNTLEAMR